MGFKFASNKTKRIELADGNWLDVRAEVSKGAFNTIVSRLPSRTKEEMESGDIKATIGDGMAFAAGLFDALVVKWSEDSMPPTLASYLLLDPADATPLDMALAEHFEAIQPRQTEGKEPTT